MAGKDFEHQVRDRIGEWDLPPSDRVWQRLESSLAQRKRRRRYFALFLLSGLLIGGGTWFMLPVPRQATLPVAATGRQETAERQTDRVPGQPASTSVQPVKKETQPAPAERERLAEAGESITAAGEPSPAASLAAASERQEAIVPGTVTKSTPADSRKKSVAVIVQGDKAVGASNLPRLPVNKPPGKTDLIPPADSRAARDQKVLAQAPADPAGAKDSRITPTDAGTPHPDATGPVPVARLSAVAPRHAAFPPATPRPGQMPGRLLTDVAMPLKQDPETVDITPSNKRNKAVVFGVSAGFGRSAFSDGLIGSIQKSADAVANAPGSAPPPSTPYDYQQDPGAAYSLGAWVRMPLAARWVWSAGLSYQRWATKTAVGQALPATGSVFFNGTADLASSIGYTQGSQDTYRNDYHLLLLPIDFSWQLNRGSKLPVLWEFGVSPGMLLSSNALVVDTANALFSHPDNQRRFQFGLRSAIMFRLMPASPRPVELGPVLQYQLNKVFVDAVRDNGHLYFLGVEARMPIFSRILKQRKLQ